MLELGRSETPEVHVMWVLGPLCWFLLTASGVNAVSVTGALPLTAFWGGGE